MLTGCFYLILDFGAVRERCNEFEKSGFRGPLNYYRNHNLTWQLTEGAATKIEQPALFVAGEADGVIAMAGPALENMPNYVTDSGYVEHRDVRTRVGRKGLAPQTVWLVDLDTGEKHKLGLDKLPGIKDDPLADLRAGAIEHFVGLGEERDKAEKRLKAPDVRGVEPEAYR